MSSGVSPRLFAITLTLFPGLTTLTLTAPPTGARLFAYLATADLFTSQPVLRGMSKTPATPS